MKKLSIVFALGGWILSLSVMGQTFSTSGFWDIAGNWAPASVPNSTSTDVTIGNNIDPTIRSTGGPYVIGNISAAKTTFTVNSAGSLTLGSSSLFPGTKKSMTLTNNATLSIAGTLEIWGDLIVSNSLTLDITGTMIVHGNITMSNGGALDVSGSGTLTVGGNLTGGNTTTITTSGSATIGVSGTISVAGGGSSISGPAGSISAGSCSCSGCSGGTCGSTVLPVTLVSFSATSSQENIILKWATASELNFNYFSLEKSGDGKSFDEITQVKGHGTTNEAHNYSFEDNYPIIGRSYYRLISNDFDGYQETFKVVSVVYHGEKKFQVSPNPSDGLSVKLNFNFENDADAQVIIYDNLGSAIGSYHVLGSGSINFDNSLKSGVYLAKYTSTTFTKTERFLVK